MADVPAVIPAIYDATKNSRIRTSMAFGSDLESGWSGTAANTSGATGWYQILLPVHPGVTAQEAEDATWSTNYMLPAYTSAVANVPDNIWTQDPELAAEQAVITAEQPGGPFPQGAPGPYGGEGVAVVDSDWQNVANTLIGQWKPGNNIALPAATDSATKKSGGPKDSNAPAPPLWQSILEAVAGDPTGIEQYAVQQAASGNSGGIGQIWDFFTNPVDALERLGLIIFGAIIVIVGLVILATGSRSGKAVAAGATRGVSSRVSGLVSGAGAQKAERSKEQQQRFAIANKANELGERKLALKESREQRLSARANVQRPAQGRHRKVEAA